MATIKVPKGMAKISLKLRYADGSTELSGMIPADTATLITLLSFSSLSDEQKAMRDALISSIRSKE